MEMYIYTYFSKYKKQQYYIFKLINYSPEINPDQYVRENKEEERNDTVAK